MNPYYIWPKIPRVDGASTSKINARVRADERAQGIGNGNIRKKARHNTKTTGGGEKKSESDERTAGTGTT